MKSFDKPGMKLIHKPPNFKIDVLKFVFSKKATKIDKAFTVDLTFTT